ncbi:SDR family oxidoreductase [Leucobacter musarum]|uniref:SDR family oxidoreductase n=1 Tax=Leucobacter musarum TaxID=1930747 RepID=UPI0006A7941E|nr:3-beta hydroxysteroid dehydrogenase [Leucobacter musarum]
MSIIAVAGGTGTVGTHVVEVAREQGFDVRVLSRASGVDLVSGAGLDLTGVDAVIDASGTTTTSAAKSRAFFAAASAALLAAGAAAGVRHHVALSIVGVDRAPHGYYAGKAVQETAVTAGTVPWSVLRATQFHEFAAQMIDRMRLGPWVGAPAMRSQPIAARTVAEHLVALAVGEPVGLAPDLVGPREERMAQMMRALLAHRGDGARVIELPLPGGFGRALRDGSILPSDPAHAEIAGPAFDAWLSAQPTRS